MAYLGKVFENLGKKNQSFERFKNFWRFWVLTPSCRANSERRKQQKIQKTSFPQQFDKWSDIFMGINLSFR